MTPFILYQLKVAVGVLFFTCLYYILFRKETFHRTNRIYLVLSLLTSALLPLIKIPEFNPPSVQAVNELISSVTVIPEVTSSEITVERTPVLIILYRTMMVLFSIHLLYLVIRLVISALRHGSVRLGKYHIVSLSRKSQSFSFFNLIFIASPISNETEQNQVLQHEMAHARQWHSLDILIVQIFKIFQWFNPFIYLAEKALQETHEYLADEAVLEQDGDSNGYRLLLLTRVFGVQPGIVSLFNYSLIKNRMIMMTRQKSPLQNRLKYLTVLPLIAAICVLLNCTRENAEEPPISDDPNAGIDLNTITDDDSMYVFVDEQAVFMGGTLEKFRDWVQQNVKYPDEALKNGISGRVTVQFAVNSKGEVGNIKILRGVDPLLDAEVVRALETSPDWIPAKVKGIQVKQQFVMPVIFGVVDKSYPPPPPPPPPGTVVGENEKAYVFVDEVAKFQGGSLETFREWVQRNLVYPEKAVKEGIFGRVTVQFTVNREGKTSEVKILRGVHPLLDEETIRVIKSSPSWTAAILNNEPVSQQFVMPVIFQLK